MQSLSKENKFVGFRYISLSIFCHIKRNQPKSSIVVDSLPRVLDRLPQGHFGPNIESNSQLFPQTSNKRQAPLGGAKGYYFRAFRTFGTRNY